MILKVVWQVQILACVLGLTEMEFVMVKEGGRSSKCKIRMAANTKTSLTIDGYGKGVS